MQGDVAVAEPKPARGLSERQRDLYTITDALSLVHGMIFARLMRDEPHHRKDVLRDAMHIVHELCRDLRQEAERQ